METLQVQPAGAAAPTLPASTSAGGTPTADGSFASTFGHALDDMLGLAPEGSSIITKAPPREKGAAGNSSESSSMAGIFLACFATNLIPPAPVVALSTEGATASVNLSSPELTADSQPNSSSSLNTAAVETSANLGTFPTAVGPVGKSPAWAGNGVMPAAFAKAEAPRSAGRERGHANNLSTGPVTASGQNQSSDTANSRPVGTPHQLPEPQDNSLVGKPADQQVGGLLFASNQLQTLSSWSTQAAASRQKSPASPSFTDSQPQLGSLDLKQVQAASPSASSQDSQATYEPPLTVGQSEQAAPAFSTEASDDSIPGSATGHTELADFSSLMGTFAEASGRADTNSTPRAVQTQLTTPGYGLEASDNPIPDSATDYPALTGLSSIAESLKGQDLQSSITPPVGRVGQAPPEGAEASQPHTPASTTGGPEIAEFSGLLGKFADAEISVRVSGNESPQAPAVVSSTTKSTPVMPGTLSGDLGMTAANSVQFLPASKSENLVNIPAKVILHPAAVSGGAATEVAWQNGNEPAAANLQVRPSSSSSWVPSPQLDANSQAGNPTTVLQRDVDPEATGIQPSGAVYTNAGGSEPPANLADASTSGQAKSRQQNGQISGNNPASVTTIAPNIANSSSGDPTTNLLTAHVPSVTATHANTSTVQSPPSSNGPSSTLPAWQNYDGGAGKIVRSASLNDSAGGAEMHVELRTGALGPLELRAVVHEGSVGAEIHVQGQDAHTLLAAGLPSLERALGERNLRVENLSVYQDQTGGGASGGGKQDSHSGSSPSPQRQTSPWDNPPQTANPPSGASEDEESFNPAAGLSVRA
jgi:hypothetical protein